MKTKLASLLALALAGCATAPQIVTRTYTIAVEPVDAHVQIRDFAAIKTDGMSPQILGEADTVNKRAKITITQKADALIDVSATATGWEQEFVPQSKKTDADFTIHLRETLGTMIARDEAAKKSRRENFIAAHPDLPKAAKESIASGQLETGMNGAMVDAAIGPLVANTQSNGVGGAFDIYTAHADGATLYLFFLDGRLARWSKTY
ncbi:MAG: hypothetical protein KGL39_56115 [Patescibacteria group bacterium]|nr:hypothetical protein [Patescibacteria group bacterium]